MIIEMLLSLIYRLLDLLLVFEIPRFPTSVTIVINTAFDYLVTGASVLANYIPFGTITTMFFLILSVDVGINIYHFVMWIIKKIPMLGVK